MLRPSDTPAWVPFYNAQLKRKAEMGRSGWAVGAGDGPTDATSSRDQGKTKTGHRECYRHHHSHQHCYRSSQQRTTTTTSNDKSDSRQKSQQVNMMTSQDRQKLLKAQSHGLQSTSSKSAASSPPTGDSGPLWNTPSEVVDSNLRARARSEKNRARSDSGLRDPSFALCLWRATNKTSPAPFACLPWQLQATQMALEARNFAQSSY